MTVYPASLSGDYLTVSDALNQVLDLIDALERSETLDASERQVVWRLTEARTNSPPFTVVAEPFPSRTDLIVFSEAQRVTTLFSEELRSLLDGGTSDLMTADAVAPISRILQRNLNGISRTEIQFGEDDPIEVRPASARVAMRTIDQAIFEAESSKPDWQRTEFGTVEGEIAGLTTWNGKPALRIVERLAERRFTCVLSGELSEQIGPSHQWNEVWEGQRVTVTGELHYSSDGDLHRATLNSSRLYGGRTYLWTI